MLFEPGSACNEAAHMADEVIWTEAVRDQLLRAAAAAAPRECVVVLGGTRAGTQTSVTDLVAVPNAAFSCDSFALAPDVFASAEHTLRDPGLAFLGFAHSHPEGTPAPSLRDRAELWTGCLQLIVAGERVHAYRLDRDRVPHVVSLTMQGPTA